jgi:hypothetical protein
VHHAITGSNNSKAVETSYQVAFLIARAEKSHTIREELILPAVKEMANTRAIQKETSGELLTKQAMRENKKLLYTKKYIHT